MSQDFHKDLILHKIILQFNLIFTNYMYFIHTFYIANAQNNKSKVFYRSRFSIQGIYEFPGLQIQWIHIFPENFREYAYSLTILGNTRIHSNF